MRKVMILTPDLRLVGGIESHTAALASGLQSRGFEVTIVAARPSGEPALDAAAAVLSGLADEDVPEPSVAALESLLRRVGPELVHAHTDLGRSVLGVLQQRAPVLRSVHDYRGCFASGQKYFSPGQECYRAQGPLCVPNALIRNCGHRKVPQASPRAYKRTQRGLESLRQVDGVIAYSDYLANDLKINGIPKVSVAPLFVAPALPRPPSPGRPRVLFVGRLVPAKGVDTLIKAAALAAAPLDVHGEGRDERRLRRLVTRLGVEDHVVFHGHSDAQALDRAYAAATVVAVPSIWPEPFGLVGLEAMTRCRAVLGSRTGGIPEWLSDGQTGRLVPPGDVQAWAQTLREMLADPDRCHRLGQAGRLRVQEHFTLERHLARLLPAYEGARAHWSRTHSQP